MPKTVKVDGRLIVVPDDATPDEIDQISKSSGTPATNAPEIHAAPQFPSPGWFKEKAYGVADKVTNALPALGGIGGGFLGGAGGTVAGLGFGGVPGAVGGAALGGAAGESARQLARRAIFPASKGWTSGIPQTSGEAAQDIGTEALKQGAYEAGGQALRAGAHAIAPKLAEASVAPGKRFLKSQNMLPEDAEIGKTILANTTGVRPRNIVGQLKTKVANDESQMRNLVSAADAQYTANPIGAPSLVPARDVVDTATKAAEYGNSKPARDALGALRQPLTTDLATGTKLSDTVLPSRIRAIKQQGVGDQIGTWHPDVAKIPSLQVAKERTYGALNGEFHRAVPGSEALDSSMSQLIPARDAAYNASFNPTVTRGIIEKYVRPTGALVGPIVGGEEGYRHGGVAGGIGGMVVGAVAPQTIFSPEGIMTAARLANAAGGPIRAIRYAAPIAEGEYTKPSAKYKRPGDTENEE